MPTRVLMIDDAVPLHRIVECRLRAGDVELHTALDGASGLAAAEQLRPGVILMDVDLPDLDGFEVCRRLKANGATAEIPVLFLTAEGGGTNRQAGLDLGAVGYLTKPFRHEELCAAVRGAIGARAQAGHDAGVDGVTGLWTRQRLERHLAAGRPGPTACVVADVDGLRLINAQHGEAFGDAVLRAVGHRFVGQRRTERVVVAAGGGRFVIVLPDADRRAARRFAGRLGEALRREPIRVLGHEAAVSCSFGVADTAVADPGGLVGRAEGALARAKRNGAGRTCVARAPRGSAAA